MALMLATTLITPGEKVTSPTPFTTVADLSAATYLFMKKASSPGLDGLDVVVCDTLGEASVGTLRAGYDGTNGRKPAPVVETPGDIVTIVAGSGGFAVGPVTTNALGKAITAVSTNIVMGVALVARTVEDQYGTMRTVAPYPLP